MKKKIGRLLEFVGLKKIGIRFDLYVGDQKRSIEKKIRMKLIPFLVKRRSGKGFLAIDLDSDWLGLGARIVKTLEILLFCDEQGLQPFIRYSYRDNSTEDYFGALFYYRTTPSVKPVFTKIRDIDELQWREDYNGKLKLDTAGKLFNKYLGIRQEIMEEVAQFCAKYFAGKKTLGVHYRGTDKAGEALLVSEEKLVAHINATLLENPLIELVFLSTDDENIIRYVMSAPISRPVVYRQDEFRSKDGDQFHRKKENSKTVVNREALINCLLLSNCSVLLKTASLLSDCSVIFNPTIEVKVMSVPRLKRLITWPASELIERSTVEQ